jgi:two-component sensor histidine kinase
MLDAALENGRIVRQGDPQWRHDVPVRAEAIPVRRGGRILGVIGRNTSLVSVRTPSRLELTYLQCAGDLARMVSTGLFPQIGASAESNALSDGSPRVGDGLIRLDGDGVVTYASPNALSAYHRLGLSTDMVGLHLGKTTAELAPPARGPVDEALVKLASGWAPRQAEVESGDGVVQLRAIPLKPKGDHIGSLVLLRDVTELRRRERELMTKDATIREIHHRVKNNLQTVAALLRLQSRRMDNDAARGALDEAVRRVGSIAIVHETLSQNLDEHVAFDEIADRVLAMVMELSQDGRVTARRSGSFGILSADVATPLAMVLTEILQNALEHAYGPKAGGEVTVRAVRGRMPAPDAGWGSSWGNGGNRGEEQLLITVTDDGVGLPEGFDPQRGGNLGLQIVRTLVVGELGGSFDMVPVESGGTRVVLEVPVGSAAP